MQRRKIAAHIEVIKSRGQERGLFVALTATRREAVLVDVIGLVASYTEISRAPTLFAILVACAAGKLVVSPFEGEVTNIVGLFDVAKA